MTLIADLQALDPGATIELFVLDSSAIAGGGIVRFHAGRNQVAGDIVWQGSTYSAFPIEAGGFEISGKGTLPRPTISVANVDGTVGLLVRDLEDLIGATVTRKRTLVKYLDAVNFTGGVNPTADTTQYLPDDVYLVERKSVETKDVITFELASALDVHGVRVPRRLIQATICPWVYKGSECGYAGGLPTCTYTLTDCKTHFGTGVDLPFGGFPGAATIR